MSIKSARGEPAQTVEEPITVTMNINMQRLKMHTINYMTQNV